MCVIVPGSPTQRQRRACANDLTSVTALINSARHEEMLQYRSSEGSTLNQAEFIQQAGADGTHHNVDMCDFF